MPSTTHAQVKKLVIGAEKRSTYNPAKLILAEHGSTLFATNSYWLVNADKVRPLLDQYNLPVDKPAVYTVGTKVAAQEQDPPNLAYIMPAADAPIIEPIRVAGPTSAHAYQRWTGGFLALFTATDGTLQGFNSDFLAWIDNDGNVDQIPQGYGSRLTGEPIYRQSGPGKPLAVYAARETKSGGNNSETGWVPEKWTADGEAFLGLLMPVRIS